jgi:hypothetical protein
MKFTTTQNVEKEVTHLRASLGVRYWEDAAVNGVEENNDDPKIPLRDDGRWILAIDLTTGQIANWPAVTTASTHYKVCDDGVYSLLDASGTAVAVRGDGYVPDMLCPSGEGYGDYVIMDIDENGVISQWKADLSYFEGYDE